MGPFYDEISVIFFLSFRLKLFCSFLAALLFDVFVSTDRQKEVYFREQTFLLF